MTISARSPVDNGWARDFNALIAAWAASLTGDGLRVVALPLLALATGRTAGAVAVVAVAVTAPWLLVAIPAGAVVDRLSPRRMIAGAHVIRAVVTAALAAAVLTGAASIALLCVAGFLITSAETFADAASQSLLVAVVPASQLERANARFVTVETVALDLVGPLAAGGLFLLSPALPFLVSTLAFLVAAVLIRRVKWVQAAPRAAQAGTGWGRASLRDMREGLSHLFRSRVLRSLVLTVAVLAMANAAIDAVLVVFSTDSLGLSAGLYPTFYVAYSVGTLFAAARVAQWMIKHSGASLMIAAMLGMGLSMLAAGVFVLPAVTWAAYAFLGVAGGTWNVLSASRRQRHTPRAAVARVSSAFRVVAWGVNPIGAGLGGLVAVRLNLPVVFTGAGVLTLIVAAVSGFLFYRQDKDPAELQAPSE